MINWNGIHIYDKTDVNNKLRELVNNIRALLGGKVDTPAVPGTSGQVLTTDGAGGTKWQTVQGGGSSGSIAVTSFILKGDNNGNAIASTPDSDYVTPATHASLQSRVVTLEATMCEKFTHGTSTYAQVYAAIQRQHIPYVYYNGKVYYGTYADATKVVFTSLDSNYIYDLTLDTNNTWLGHSNPIGSGTSISVIDNLTSTSTTDALSANQGRILLGLTDTNATAIGNILEYIGDTADLNTGFDTNATIVEDLNHLDDTKQAKLVSGSNIKTVGGTSILGSGDIPFPITNNLTSTETNSALSAAMGKELNRMLTEAVTDLSANIQAVGASVTSVQSDVDTLSHDVETIEQSLDGFMPKANADESILLESDGNGNARSSGYTADDLNKVLFGYLLIPTTYNYRWQFEFIPQIYTPDQGSFSVEASIRVRNTTHDIPVTGNYGDWDMPQAFAESIAAGIQNIAGLSAEVESYTSNGCSVVIHSPEEVTPLSDNYVYSTINDFIAMCMVGYEHPWISSRDIATLTPTVGEKGFYELNDPMSDRYDDSESKVYIDRITQTEYTFHDGGYHLLKAEPVEAQYDLTSLFSKSQGDTFTDSTFDAYFAAIQHGRAFAYITKQMTIGTQAVEVKVPVSVTYRGAWGIAAYYDYTEFNGSMKRILRTVGRSGSAWSVEEAWDKLFIS